MKKGRRFIALLLSMVMVLSSVSEQAFTAETSGGQSAESVGNTVENTVENTDSGIFTQQDTSGLSSTFFEVKFEMPEGFEWAEDVQKALQEEEAQAESEEKTGDEPAENQEALRNRMMIDLPENMMLREGTLISSIPAPALLGYVFLGWYYDKDLTLKVSSEDVVDRNMTLYPRFGSAEEDEGNITLDYVAVQDAEADYALLLAVVRY